MSMPFFLTKRLRPDRFDRNTDLPKISTPDKSCVCFITDSNTNYVSYTRLACREMRKHIRVGTPIFVLTDTPDAVVVPESDAVIGIAALLDEFHMHNVSSGRFPDIIFGKFLIPLVHELADFSRIVVYDPDVVACGAELNDLLDFDFQGHDCLACGEAALPKYLEELKSSLEKNDLSEVQETQVFKGRYLNKEYCSGGLIVWNAKLVRGHLRQHKHLIRFLVKYQGKCNFVLPEQSWLNICFDILPISIYYDYSWSYDDGKTYPLIHHAGSKKGELKKMCRAAGFPIEDQPVNVEFKQ